ncbi:ricin B lectin domain-containing protein [Crepidotus variabilis]|uniref:Ricin B lectin domain-containing protein n=1 Tax=Crepidotus variabilis TaxID=179855 RepID=A0A9P6E8A5_9AGAR|nr:ricin B lectin domain-containing protein [Crepidotus variabilis]
MILSRLLLLGFISGLVSSQSAGSSQYIIRNFCYTDLDLYVNGTRDSTVPNLGNVTKVFNDDNVVFFTDLNARGPNGDGSAQIGFYQDYYYMVIDPYYINTGVMIEPLDPPDNSTFCAPVNCQGLQCRSAFSETPKTFPQSAESPPKAPYYRCPSTSQSYQITFCPSGTIPDEFQPIHFNSQEKCLDLRNFIIGDGTPIQIKDCNRLVAQQWILNKGRSKIVEYYARTCLDGGLEPKSGDLLQAWTCSDDRPYQEWIYTDDQTYQLADTDLCLDLINGDTTPENRIQLLQCDASSQTQIWTL